jgi:hypothetical protein
MQLLHTGTGAVSCKYERNGRKIWETSNMEDKGMNNEVSITALMSSFGRAFHAENEDHPVFADHLAKELMTAEEYAEMMRAEGYPAHARVCERHTGAGIGKEEIKRLELPLPYEDFLPETMEEKVICYADKFFSKTHPEVEKSINEAEKSLVKFGEDGLKRFKEWEMMFE